MLTEKARSITRNSRHLCECRASPPSRVPSILPETTAWYLTSTRQSWAAAADTPPVTNEATTKGTQQPQVDKQVEMHDRPTWVKALDSLLWEHYLAVLCTNQHFTRNEQWWLTPLSEPSTYNLWIKILDQFCSLIYRSDQVDIDRRIPHKSQINWCYKRHFDLSTIGVNLDNYGLHFTGMLNHKS